MPLSDVMKAALAKADYTEPTPVQAGMIPRAMEGVDLMAQARTGTGKTAAFLIPILETLESRKPSEGPQALVLAPTRELAVQVRDEAVKLADGRNARCVAVYGGKPIRKQIERLRRGAEIVIGTPGRVMDHMQRGTLNLSRLRVLVLDEADRMLDIGFRPDIEKILRKCPQSRQTLLLSATVPPPVQRLATRYMRDPECLDFSPTDITVDTIDQYYFTVENSNKLDLLVKLLDREKPRQAIIFCRTKRQTDRVYLNLNKKHLDVSCIHGDLPQRSRDRTMDRFRKGEVQLLVATDVVGRGIDVTGISHIVNYDVPQFCDDYVHRVGRTGRMGRQGVAFTFVTSEEGNELTRIEMRINRLLERADLPGYSSNAKPVAQPGADGELDIYGDVDGNGEAADESAETSAPPAARPGPGSRSRRRRYRRAL